MSKPPTKVTVRVIARGGKFLGDDIGGAQITIRDVLYGDLLASGRTRGGSGPPTIMTACLKRTQPIPTQNPGNDACRFDADLALDEPRQIEISAFGPLAAPGSANRVSATTWIYPGHDLSPGPGVREDGFLIEIPGLLVQVLQPPAHYLPTSPNPNQAIPIRANVTMMCGCPISPGSDMWPVTDFEVTADISWNGVDREISLAYDANAEGGAPSQFVSQGWIPGSLGIFEITVFAYQRSTGNTGVGRTTVNLQ
jgi:hypothetical protein